jgi:hypothetical protein
MLNTKLYSHFQYVNIPKKNHTHYKHAAGKTSKINYPLNYVKEGPLTTSNQLLSPYTVALRLRWSNQHFYMHLMGPKM